MKKYDENLYLFNAIRARVASVTNTVLAFTCLIAGVQAKEVTAKSVWFGCAAASSVAGLVSLARSNDNRKANEDVAAISDQVRTNDIYRRLEKGDEPYDYSASAYNYLVMELGRGTSKAELLAHLDPDVKRAHNVWQQLEQRYGKLPTGDV